MRVRSVCPFCGSNDLAIHTMKNHVKQENVYRVQVAVKCNKCKAQGPKAYGNLPYLLFRPKAKVTTRENLEKQAWALWNE